MSGTTGGWQSIKEILQTMKNDLRVCPLPELSELLAESVAVRRQADATQPPKSNTGALSANVSQEVSYVRL
jgi:hypothetical protein